MLTRARRGSQAVGVRRAFLSPAGRKSERDYQSRCETVTSPSRVLDFPAIRTTVNLWVQGACLRNPLSRRVKDVVDAVSTEKKYQVVQKRLSVRRTSIKRQFEFESCKMW
jgi:hypothetical protein